MIIRITLPVTFTYGERKFNLSVKRSDSLDDGYFIRLVPPVEIKPPPAPASAPLVPEPSLEPQPETFQLYNKSQNLMFEFEHPAWIPEQISIGYTITYNAKLEREDVYSDLPEFLRREMEQFEINIINQWASKDEEDTTTFDRTNMEIIVDVSTLDLDEARAAVVRKAFAGYRKPTPTPARPAIAGVVGASDKGAPITTRPPDMAPPVRPGLGRSGAAPAPGPTRRPGFFR